MVNITKVSFLVVLFYNKLYLMCVSSYIKSRIGFAYKIVPNGSIRSTQRRPNASFIYAAFLGALTRFSGMKLVPIW